MSIYGNCPEKRKTNPGGDHYAHCSLRLFPPLAKGALCSGSRRQGYFPTSICRLPAKPGRFSTANPAAAKDWRTCPATDQVASVAPDLTRRAKARNISTDQRSGFLAGENPSRYKASAATSSCGSCCIASPKARRRITCPFSSSIRCSPAVKEGQKRHNSSENSENSGQDWCAAARSAEENGCFSTETNSSFLQRRGSFFHASQVAMKLSPRPKPVSRMENESLPCQAIGKPFPARKTCFA